MSSDFTSMYVHVHLTGFDCACDAGYVSGLSGVCDTHLCNDGEMFCLNGGSCLDTSTTTVSQCVCPSGVTGTNCETGAFVYRRNLLYCFAFIRGALTIYCIYLWQNT